MKHGAYLRYLNNLLLINPGAVKEDLPVKLSASTASFLSRERKCLYAEKFQNMNILGEILTHGSFFILDNFPGAPKIRLESFSRESALS
jgi:hypothetical protein